MSNALKLLDLQDKQLGISDRDLIDRYRRVKSNLLSYWEISQIEIANRKAFRSGNLQIDISDPFPWHPLDIWEICEIWEISQIEMSNRIYYLFGKSPK